MLSSSAGVGMGGSGGDGGANDVTPSSARHESPSATVNTSGVTADALAPPPAVPPPAAVIARPRLTSTSTSSSSKQSPVAVPKHHSPLQCAGLAALKEDASKRYHVSGLLLVDYSSSNDMTLKFIYMCMYIIMPTCLG